MSLPPSYLDAKDVRPLTEDESKTLTMLVFAAHQGDETIVPAADLEQTITKIFGEELAKSFSIQVMMKRFVAMRPDLTYSPLVLVLCAMLSDRVGVAVHWAYTIMDYNRRNDEPMTIRSWCEAFPDGIPTEPEQHRLWDEQKRSSNGGTRSDNQIDGREAWAAQHTVLS